MPVDFPSKVKKARPIRVENDRKVFFQPELSFSLFKNIIEVLFPISTSTWRGNNHFSRQR